MQEEPATLPIGAVIRKRYIVEGLLGKGGSGAVYLVRDQRTRSDLFALKEVIVQSKHELYRSLLEYQLLLRLDHPALAHVHSLLKDDQRHCAYMLMEYIEGSNLETLRQQQPEKRLSYLEAMNFMAPIIDAVGYLHRQQPPMIHRDIKPTNIIVPKTGARAMLVDFGIDKKYDPILTSGMVHSYAPTYKAPELYSGDDIRTDIYGLGATFYALVTGIVPADARSRTTQSGSTGIAPLEPVNKVVPTVPMCIGKAIDRAMSLDFHRRFSSVEQFWEALWSLVEHPVSMSDMSSVLAGPPAVSVPTPEPERAVKHTAAAMLLPKPPSVVSMADSAKEQEGPDTTKPLSEPPPVVPVPDTLKEPEDLEATKPLPEPPPVVLVPDTLKEQEDLDTTKPLPEPPTVVLMSISIKEQEDLDDVMPLPMPPSVVSMADSAKELEDLDATESLPETPLIVPVPDALKEQEGPDTTKPLPEAPLVVPVPDALKEPESLDAVKPLPKLPPVVPVPDALKEPESLDAVKPLLEPPLVAPVPDALKEREGLDTTKLPSIVPVPEDVKEPESLDAAKPLPEPPLVVPAPDALKEQEDLDTAKPLPKPLSVVSMADSTKEPEDLEAAKPLPEPPLVVPAPDALKKLESPDTTKPLPEPPLVVSMADSAKEPEDLEAAKPLPEAAQIVSAPDALKEQENLDAAKPLPKPLVVSISEDTKGRESPAVIEPPLEQPPVDFLSHSIEEPEDLDTARSSPEPSPFVATSKNIGEQEDLYAAKPLPPEPSVVSVSKSIKEPEDLDVIESSPEPSPFVATSEDIGEQATPAVAQPLLEPSPVVPMPDGIEEEEPEGLEATLRLLKLPVALMTEATKEQESPAVTEPSPVVPLPEGVKEQESPAVAKLLPRLPSVVPNLATVWRPQKARVAKLLPPLPSVVQPRISLRKLGVLFIILALLISLGIGAAFLSRAQSHPTARSTIPAPTTTAPAPTPPSTAVSSRYPRLAGAYLGTIYDLSDNVQTSMYLAGMQQTQGSFTGRLILGPGMKSGGLFKGTITMAKYLQFTVMDAAGNATLFFEGAVQSATSLSGDFYQCSPGPVQGSSCSRIPGSYGLWNVLVAPTGYSSPPSQSDFAEISRSQQGNYGRRLDSDISSS